MKLDRVKVVNEIQSTSSTGGMENSHLLNVLNWSPVENLTISKSTVIDGTIGKDENDLKSKNVQNVLGAVKLSIEIQQKMLV